MRKYLGILLAIMFVLGSVTALAEDWTCPSCNSVVSGNFCNNCGSAKPSDEWTCPNCSNIVKGKFCNNCGTARPTTTAEATQASAPAQVKDDPDALKQIINYLMKPLGNATVTAYIPMDEESFSVMMSNGDSYMGLMSFSDGVYGIDIMNISSSDYKSIDNPYDVNSEEFASVLNYLLGKDGKTFTAIIPMFGDIYTVQDNAGKAYMLTIMCSPSMVTVAMLGE